MRWIGLLAACVLAVAEASAGALPEPAGRVLLTVSGAIRNTNGDGRARFDRALLESLDWRTVESHTTWTEGPQHWSGPTLTSLLEAVGAEGDRLIARALNDYTVEIPASDAADHGILLALDRNGRPMPVRQKGPIFVIYPQDAATARSKRFNGRMIWQLRSIEIRR